MGLGDEETEVGDDPETSSARSGCDESLQRFSCTRQSLTNTVNRKSTLENSSGGYREGYVIEVGGRDVTVSRPRVIIKN